MTKVEDLRKMNKKELIELLAEHRNKLRELKFKVQQKEFKNVREIRWLKKDIARILTVMNDGNLSKSKIKNQKSK